MIESPISSAAGAYAAEDAGRATAFRAPRNLLDRVGLTLESIKFSHTIFGLPFALLGAVLATEGMPATALWREGIPAPATLLWILVACVFARSAAMAFNRLHDEPFDRRNPRTREWPLPAGLLSRKFMATFCAVCVLGFVGAAWRLNPLAFQLSPIALLILLGYSTTKRFTSAAHFFLGLALGIAPVGAWVGVRGEIALTPIVLGIGVLLWTAGFDIIYSCQDERFDRSVGLRSIPVRLGRPRALAVSALCHALALVAFASLVLLAPVGNLYLFALTLCAGLLLYEQSIVTPADLSKLGRAFFTVNGWVSVLLFLGGAADVIL